MVPTYVISPSATVSLLQVQISAQFICTVNCLTRQASEQQTIAERVVMAGITAISRQCDSLWVERLQNLIHGTKEISGLVITQTRSLCDFTFSSFRAMVLCTVGD